MKRCQMCGSAMRLDAELVEGERHYLWYKCTNLDCGAIFLVQEPIRKAPVPAPQAPVNSTVA
ncbi:MAG: hypothetical protein J7M19_04260 [Planctomycetes bacterium]|nr:hypothetical protein [Planctomycetota bacterium]